MSVEPFDLNAIPEETEEERREFWGLKEGEEFDETPIETGVPNRCAEVIESL